MTISPDSENSGPDTAVVPDITGLSPGDYVMAALVYAQYTGPVLPVAFGKHPGSIVGRGWPELSSRDPQQIERWWAENPDAWIALHTGKSGLTFFELDINELSDELVWLRSGVVQYTRRKRLRSDRGHYGFHSGTELFVSGPLKLKDGSQVGEIRSGNTVVIVAPSPHVKPEGEYRWRTDDLNRTVPPLPDEARAYLTPLGTAKAWWRGIAASSELVTHAVSEWIGDDRPKALDGQVNSIRNHTKGTGTRNLTRDALRITASESRVGFYPLDRVVQEIRSAMIESYEKRGEPAKFSEYELQNLIKNGVGYALSRSPKDILDEANRPYDDDGFAYQPVKNFGYRPRSRFGYNLRARVRR